MAAERRDRAVRWRLSVPGRRDLDGHLFDTEEQANEWLDQPWRSGSPRSRGYRVRPVVVTRCPCCRLFHIEKPNESVARAAMDATRRET